MLQLECPDSQVWGWNYSNYSLGQTTKTPNISFLMLPPPNCPRTLEAFDTRCQLPNSRQNKTTRFTAGFFPTTGKLLLLPHSSTLALHHLWHVCQLLQPYPHRPQLYDRSDGGKMTLIHAVLWWLLSWEPMQGIVPQFATNLFPTHTLKAVWLRRGSYYSCTVSIRANLLPFPRPWAFNWYYHQSRLQMSLIVDFLFGSLGTVSCPLERSSQSIREDLKLVKLKREGIG